MRLPDIPVRHRTLVRAAAVLGTTALSVVRRRDFGAEQQAAAGLIHAAATAVTTWLNGTKAFADQNMEQDRLGDQIGAFGSRAGNPVRYVSEDEFGPQQGSGESDLPVSTGDPESWWDEEATWRSQSFFNAVTAIGSGLVTWVLWNPTQNLADRWEAKFPPGTGRIAAAVLNGGTMAALCVLLDKSEEWTAGGTEATIYGQLEIELPEHIRAGVEAVLDQPHPESDAAAQRVREHLESARFFIWVDHADERLSGNAPVTLGPEEVGELIAAAEVSSIDVHPQEPSFRVVPAEHRYPVVGVAERAPGQECELRLEISDGRLSRLEFSEADDTYRVSDAGGLADALSESAPGTLHPDGLGVDTEEPSAGTEAFGVIAGQLDDEPITLADWPGPGRLTFRSDRKG